MKKRLLVAAVASIASCLAVSVGDAAAKRSASVTLTITMNVAYQKPLDLLIANFNRVYPNIAVQTTYLTNTQIAQVVPTQLQAGGGPDMWWANSGFATGAAAMAAAGKVVDLSKQPWVKRVGPISADVTYHGKIYGFPVGIVPAGVFYNSAEFRQLGLKAPTTFNQLLSLCTKIKAAGKIPIAYAMGSGTGSIQNAFDTLAVTTPAYAQDPNWTQQRTSGKVTFAGSAAWTSPLQGVTAMINAGCFPPHPEGLSIGDFAGEISSGQALMALDSSAFEAGLKVTTPSWPLDSTFAFPSANQKQTQVLAFVSPVIAINKASHHVAQAVTFVNFLGRAKQNSLFNKVASQIAPFDAGRGVLPSWGKGLVPYFKAKKVINNPASAWPNAGENALFIKDMVGLFTGQSTVDSIVKDLDNNWNAP